MPEASTLPFHLEVTYALLLGVLEGLTEFLPVSSTAHLRLTQSTLGIPMESPFWKLFAVWIQLGAILALVWVYRARVMVLLTSFVRASRSGQAEIVRHPIVLILISFVMTAGPALLLKKTISKNLESQALMAHALWIGGVLMLVLEWIAHRFPPSRNELSDIKISHAMSIGLAQAVAAVIPGTSRSMITIGAGQLCRMSRSLALDYSFWISIPTMIAACCYDLLKTLVSPDSALRSSGLTATEWLLLMVGLVVAFIVAWGVIVGFLRWVRSHGLIPFALYRIVAGFWLLSHFG